MKGSFVVAFCLLATLDVGSACAQSLPPLDMLRVQLKMQSEPSQADIQALFEAWAKVNQNHIVLHEVKKLGCKDFEQPNKGQNFYCDVEADLTSLTSGRQKETLATEIYTGRQEKWVLLNVRKKISEFRGRYSDDMGTMTILFEPGGEATLFRKEGGSYAGKYEIYGRQVKIISRTGEPLIVLNMYDDGSLWMDYKGGRNMVRPR